MWTRSFWTKLLENIFSVYISNIANCYLQGLSIILATKLDFLFYTGCKKLLRVVDWSWNPKVVFFTAREVGFVWRWQVPWIQIVFHWITPLSRGSHAWPRWTYEDHASRGQSRVYSAKTRRFSHWSAVRRRSTCAQWIYTHHHGGGSWHCSKAWFSSS